MRCSITLQAVRLAALAVVALSPFAGSRADSDEKITGQEVAALVSGRPDGDDRKMEMKLTLINRRGQTRERTLVSVSKDFGKSKLDRKTLLVFRAPADVRGTGLLLVDWHDPASEDDRWLYLPSMRKVRRISGASRGDFFMGTDFTYEDLGRRSAADDSHRLRGEHVLDGHLCWKLESVPEQSDAPYRRRESWIRKDAQIPVRVQFYDRKNRLARTLEVLDLRRHQGYWTVHKMRMTNHLDNHRTVLELVNVQFDVGVQDSLFRTSSLERGRIR